MTGVHVDRRFKAVARPDEQVVYLFERALRAARSGRVRSASIVLVTHTQVETESAGEMSPPRMDSLVAGLAMESYKLLAERLGGKLDDPEDPPKDL